MHFSSELLTLLLLFFPFLVFYFCFSNWRLRKCKARHGSKSISTKTENPPRTKAVKCARKVKLDKCNKTTTTPTTKKYIQISTTMEGRHSNAWTHTHAYKRSSQIWCRNAIRLVAGPTTKYSQVAACNSKNGNEYMQCEEEWRKRNNDNSRNGERNG